MLKKRIIGVVLVREGIAVQAFKYRDFLPLGDPKVQIEKLNRWEVDEILVQSIDRTLNGLGPDFALISRISSSNLSTPLIYGGGIRNAQDAVECVKLGADRIIIDSLIWDNPDEIERISIWLGTQAVIANFPVRVTANKKISWINYRDRSEQLLVCDHPVIPYLKFVSEIVLSDYDNDGQDAGFNQEIPLLFPNEGCPILAFGGISLPIQVEDLLKVDKIAAVGIGNFLTRKEHSVQLFKNSVESFFLRPAVYIDEAYRL